MKVEDLDFEYFITKYDVKNKIEENSVLFGISSTNITIEKIIKIITKAFSDVTSAFVFANGMGQAVPELESILKQDEMIWTHYTNMYPDRKISAQR